MAYHQANRVHKVMIQPINVIFRHLQNRTRVSVWVYDQPSLKIEGVVVGFDEYMNVVLEDAEEVTSTKRRRVGRILLRGDSVSLIQPVAPMYSIIA